MLEVEGYLVKVVFLRRERPCSHFPLSAPCRNYVVKNLIVERD